MSWLRGNEKLNDLLRSIPQKNGILVERLDPCVVATDGTYWRSSPRNVDRRPHGISRFRVRAQGGPLFPQVSTVFRLSHEIKCAGRAWWCSAGGAARDEHQPPITTTRPVRALVGCFHLEPGDGGWRAVVEQGFADSGVLTRPLDVLRPRAGG